MLWLVDHPTFLDESLYRNALDLLDSSSQERVRLFYHRADSCRCIIGRLLPRVLLSEKGVSAENIQFAKTDAGKPYFARRLLFFLSVLTLAPASTVVLLVPAGHDGRQSTHRV